MTQENKELLFKDLCARLPYGVKFSCDIKGVWTLKGIIHNGINYICWPNAVALEVVKPYLRPMSSMTEEEKKEFSALGVGIHLFKGPLIPSYDTLDWLNAHHFDYRGLIEKGLAIAVTEENNPYKKRNYE